MAFIGIFLMWAIPIILIICFCTFAAIALFIISAVIKHSYKKKAAVYPATKKPVAPLILKIVGTAFFLPHIAVIALIINYFVQNEAYQQNSLWYNVNTGNFERAEELLKEGASPNCSEESNDPAAEDEIPILITFCINNGFTVTSGPYEGRPVDLEFTEDEKRMLLLLIEYGADIDCRFYWNPTHDFDNAYLNSDGCGCTPLLWAVKNGNFDLVQLLAENGADINAKDAFGYNAVAIAADELNDRNGTEIVQYLLDNGAETDCMTYFGRDIGFFLFRNMKDGNEKIAEILGYDLETLYYE